MQEQIRAAIAAAFKQNFLPGLILQCFALAILLVYFFVPQSQATFAWFSQRKQDYGFLYSAVSTAICGGLVPVIYLWLSGRLAKASLFSALLFYCLFWAYKGMEVDAFYRLQNDWFGSESNLQTVATKMAVDQFGYSALWSAPSIALIYLWRELGYSFSGARRALTREFVLIKIPTNIFSNWLVWSPAVSVVYAMPADLQIPLFNLVLCFWVLMLSVLNKK